MIKMILTDGDGTLWGYDNPFLSSFEALSKLLPEKAREKWSSKRDAFFGKEENSYSQWFAQQLEMLKGISAGEMDKILFPIPYSKGAKEFFSSIGKEVKKGIVSSGISFVADKARDELGMDFAFSNILNIFDGKFTGDGELIIDLESKGDFVRKLAKENRIKLSEICYIGDDLNDLPALEIVGYPIAFNSNKKELGKFRSVADFSELASILEAS